MENNTHNEDFSIAVDRALLKLSKDYNISLPKDDYILVQLFLNKEILNETFANEISELKSENLKTKKFFRDALAMLTKQHNEKFNSKFESFEKIVKICLVTSSLSLLVSSILIINYFVGG